MTMNSFGSSSRFLRAFLLSMALPSLHADTTTYPGIDTLGCTDGECKLIGVCDDTVITFMPGKTEDNVTFTEVTGEVAIFPETCSAECKGCLSTGADVDECVGTGGFVYCPELDECIRPWQENCPFEGTRFVGPVEITCEQDFRCNDLTDACSIAIGSSSVGGPYLSGLDAGTYELGEDCLATCEGCSCVDEDNCPISGGVTRNEVIGRSAFAFTIGCLLSWSTMA